ncbi:MAG: hypothetical protein COA36_17490 [Desulfotalea sp.]|nr:MAG: hypothetical protein COA36_17490 [Desulfotalea sp.]
MFADTNNAATTTLHTHILKTTPVQAPASSTISFAIICSTGIIQDGSVHKRALSTNASTV